MKHKNSLLSESARYFQVHKQSSSNSAVGLEDAVTVDTGIDSESCHILLEWFSVITDELVQVTSHLYFLQEHHQKSYH